MQANKIFIKVKYLKIDGDKIIVKSLLFYTIT